LIISACHQSPSTSFIIVIISILSRKERGESEELSYVMYLDVVDGVDVVHAVLDDVADLLEALVGTHDRHGVTLHQHVALGQQLDRLERRAVGT
jgi:hypothetical protein